MAQVMYVYLFLVQRLMAELAYQKGRADEMEERIVTLETQIRSLYLM
jgi:hypothetical protein